MPLGQKVSLSMHLYDEYLVNWISSEDYLTSLSFNILVYEYFFFINISIISQKYKISYIRK